MAVRWRFVAVGVTVAFALMLSGAVAWRAFNGGVGGDFAVFWRTATTPLGSIYASYVFPFAYPPSALPWIFPFGLVGYWPAYWLFIALSCAGFYWAGCRAYSRSAVLLAALSPAMWWALSAGQITPLLAAAIFTAFTLPPAYRGAIVAVVLSIKPQFAFVAPLVLWRDRPALLSMVGTGAALLLVNVLIWGPQTWLAWLQSLWAFSNVAAQDGIRRVLVSMPGQASFYDLPALPAQVIAIGVAALFAMRQPIKDHAALIVGCSIFASPYAMPYDLVALAPWAAERLLRDRLSWHSIASALIYLGVAFPLAWLVSLSVRWRTAVIVDDLPPARLLVCSNCNNL